MMEDYFTNIYLKAAQTQDDDNVEEAILVQLPIHLEMMANQLSNSKFICGDEISIYDFMVGGLFSDLIFNPKTLYKPYFDQVWETAP